MVSRCWRSPSRCSVDEAAEKAALRNQHAWMMLDVIPELRPKLRPLLLPFEHHALVAAQSALSCDLDR